MDARKKVYLMIALLTLRKKCWMRNRWNQFVVPKLCDTYTNSCQCDPSPAEETIMDQLSKDCQDVYHVDNYDNNDDGDYYDGDTNYANHAIRHIAEGNDDRCRSVLTASKTNCPLYL